MSGRRTRATAARVLTQLSHDRRTVALLIVAPCLVMGLVAWMFEAQPRVIDTFGPVLLGIFPFVFMFLVTSVAMQRERTSGTLERLMTLPLGKADLLFGYGAAFALLAAAQALVLTAWGIWVCGMDVAGSVWLVLLLAVLDAVLASSLGLAASSLARTEFQAVQMLPIVIIPQVLLCGFLMPRSAMPHVLDWLSNVMPLTYAVDAMQRLAAGGAMGRMWVDAAVIAAFAVASIGIGIGTLRRRTP
jgi:ABC-2 type transport system permease protein